MNESDAEENVSGGVDFEAVCCPDCNVKAQQVDAPGDRVCFSCPGCK